MKNIYWLKSVEKWMVRFKGIYLGTFKDLDDAVECLENYKEKYPKAQKIKINTTLTGPQYQKFKKLGGCRWLKNFLDN